MRLCYEDFCMLQAFVENVIRVYNVDHKGVVLQFNNQEVEVMVGGTLVDRIVFKRMKEVKYVAGE